MAMQQTYRGGFCRCHTTLSREQTAVTKLYQSDQYQHRQEMSHLEETLPEDHEADFAEEG